MACASNVGKGLDPGDVLVEANIHSLTKSVGLKWKDLGRRLGYKESDIDTIQSEKKEINQECCIEVLVGWMRREGQRATVGRLAQALKKIERTDLAETLIGPQNEKGTLHLDKEGPDDTTKTGWQLRQDKNTGDKYFIRKCNKEYAKLAQMLRSNDGVEVLEEFWHTTTKANEADNPQIELEKTKEERIYMKLGKFNEELQRLSDILATNEVREDKLKIAVRLDTCKRLNAGLQELYTCAKNLSTETHQCDEALKNDVNDSVLYGLRAIHNDLTKRVEDLESSTADMSEEEKEELVKLVRYQKGLQTQVTRMDRFLKLDDNLPKDSKSTPERESKKEELPQRSNTFPREEIVSQSLFKRLKNVMSKKDTSDSEQCSLTAFCDTNSRCGNDK